MNTLKNTVAALGDYHEGEDLVHDIRSVFNVDLKCEELGFWEDRGEYVFIFWTGRKPGKVQTNVLLKEALNITLEDIEQI